MSTIDNIIDLNISTLRACLDMTSTGSTITYLGRLVNLSNAFGPVYPGLERILTNIFNAHIEQVETMSPGSARQRSLMSSIEHWSSLGSHIHGRYTNAKYRLNIFISTALEILQHDAQAINGVCRTPGIIDHGLCEI